ncbi:putative glutaredoxin, Thioredoxin-like superfamily [Helianthus annuus]|nr:putative glutaredoxin, Thioredoxin-like superfamily [Helianthus annuus]KAJ0769346.1 putative glutaredoxin, Thioredoxin-like superfamily [Helianthus annuus]
MGCTSSQLLNQDDDFTHHIVSLTSTTYGLLTLDPSSSPTTLPPTPQPRFTLSEPPQPEVINSWELMAGLGSTPESFHFSPQPSKPSPFRYPFQENSNPNHKNPIFTHNSNPDHKNPIFIKPVDSKPVLFDGFEELCTPKGGNTHKNPIFTKLVDSKPVFLDGFGDVCSPKGENNHKDSIFVKPMASEPEILDGFEEICSPNGENNHKDSIFTESVDSKPEILDGFEELCPPKGENKVVIYTTSLRGVRKTFEACNAVRAVLEGFRVMFSERDVSMDRGFREELWELMKGKDKSELVPPRVFVKGRYVGGSDEVLRIVEEGCLGQLLDGLPKLKPGYVCETCGGARFLPCCSCNGSCKVVMDGDQFGETVTVKCTDCNENGLVRCPVCS